MTISMYQASVPRFVNILNNLSNILDKAEAHSTAKKIDPAILLSARLFPDMLPLSRQVQIACDSAKGAAARLAGLPVPPLEDNEKTFEELKTRITKTIAIVESVPAAQIDGSENREIVLKIGDQNLTFSGMQYLLGFAIPNFYFHVTTAYNILRHSGVDVGKRDFIGNP